MLLLITVQLYLSSFSHHPTNFGCLDSAQMDDWITWTCYGMALVVGNCSQFSDHMVRVVDKFPRSLQCFLLATVILVRQAIVRYGPGCRYKEQSTDVGAETLSFFSGKKTTPN